MYMTTTHPFWKPPASCVILVILSFAALMMPAPVLGQASSASGSVELALRQSQLSDRYRQLESLLLKMAEYDSGANPRRAALLRQALSRGKERQIGTQLDGLVKLFQQEQLQKAIEGQTSVKTDLEALLDLLRSENRPDRLKNEQARVRGYIKQLDRIIRQQKSVQGRTAGGESAERLSGDQQRIADQTKKLGAEIDESEGLESGEGKDGEGKDGEGKDGEGKDGEGKDGEGKDGEGKDGEGKDGEGKDGEGKDGEGKDGEGKDGEGKDGEGKDGEGQQGQGQQGQGQQGEGQQGEGQQGEGQQGEGQQGQGQQGQGQQGQGQQGQGQQGQGQQGEGQQGENQQQQTEQQDQNFPGRKRIAAAEDRMRAAQERLDKAERDKAVEEQEAAKRLLEQAKAELEEILRQLREEEIERVLAMLEGRFRKMLEMELKIQDSTVRMNKTPAAKRTRQFTVKAGKLSMDQRKVVLEVDKALTLLREEGSSVAFPEAVQQMRSDMNAVARRIAEEKVGTFTQGLEEDIILALEEMIAALQKAQKDAEERKQQQQQQGKPGQNGQPGDEPLVNKIAELKMIRALQMRVNKRTQRYSKMLADVEDPVGQATDDDLLDSLRELSDRQKRIYKVTSDIVLEKNK